MNFPKILNVLSKVQYYTNVHFTIFQKITYFELFKFNPEQFRTSLTECLRVYCHLGSTEVMYFMGISSDISRLTRDVN